MYPLLETDVYKTVHHAQYPEDMSYHTLFPEKAEQMKIFLSCLGCNTTLKSI